MARPIDAHSMHVTTIVRSRVEILGILQSTWPPVCAGGHAAQAASKLDSCGSGLPVAEYQQVVLIRVQVLPKDDPKADEDDEDYVSYPVGDHIFRVSTAHTEEKANALNMLSCYAEHMEHSFAPYCMEVAATVEHVLSTPLLNNEEMRTTAAALVPLLLGCMQDAHKQGSMPEATPEAVQALFGTLMKGLIAVRSRRGLVPSLPGPRQSPVCCAASVWSSQPVLASACVTITGWWCCACGRPTGPQAPAGGLVLAACGGNAFTTAHCDGSDTTIPSHRMTAAPLGCAHSRLYPCQLHCACATDLVTDAWCWCTGAGAWCRAGHGGAACAV